MELETVQLGKLESFVSVVFLYHFSAHNSQRRRVGGWGIWYPMIHSRIQWYPKGKMWICNGSSFDHEMRLCSGTLGGKVDWDLFAGRCDPWWGNLGCVYVVFLASFSCDSQCVWNAGPKVKRARHITPCCCAFLNTFYELELSYAKLLGSSSDTLIQPKCKAAQAAELRLSAQSLPSDSILLRLGLSCREGTKAYLPRVFCNGLELFPQTVLVLEGRKIGNGFLEI